MGWWPGAGGPEPAAVVCRLRNAGAARLLGRRRSDGCRLHEPTTELEIERASHPHPTRCPMSPTPCPLEPPPTTTKTSLPSSAPARVTISSKTKPFAASPKSSRKQMPFFFCLGGEQEPKNWEATTFLNSAIIYFSSPVNLLCGCVPSVAPGRASVVHVLPHFHLRR